MELVRVRSHNIQLLQRFLENAGESLVSFRYYTKRPHTIVSNHLVTYLLCEHNEPVCYGHLDPGDKKVWLGIAVAEKFRGRGIGRLMMQHLLDFARQNQLNEIHLSVDRGNSAAIDLYRKMGFSAIGEKSDVLFYRLVIGS